MNPLYRERDELQRRIHMARSSDEARYYEEKLWRLEREAMLLPQREYEQMRMAPMPPSFDAFQKAEAETPLSFLKNADKKLLLTGATS